MERNHEISLSNIYDSTEEIFDEFLINIDPDEPSMRIVISDLKEKILDSLDRSIDEAYKDHESVVTSLEMEVDELDTRIHDLGEEL